MVDAEDCEGDEKILVWEMGGFGKYQVRYLAQSKIIEKDYDRCIFRYWLCKERLCREVMEKDPMRPAIERIVAEAKGAISQPNQLYDMEKPLETVLSWID